MGDYFKAGAPRAVSSLLQKHEAVKWPGIDSQDFLTYLNGKIYKREILEWDVKQSFSLLIERLMDLNHL